MSRIYRINLKTRTETAAYYDITKEMAADWLEHNNHINRGFKPALAKRYGRDRINGKWYTTDQAISFDWDGQLVNGQHRLTFIRDTELTTRMLVVTGLDPIVRMVTDIGARRSPSDILQLIGREDANTRTVAIVRQMMNGTNRGASIPEVVDAYDIHHEAAITAQGCFPKQNLKNITIAPVMGVVGRASRTEDLAKLEEFGEKLYYGKGEKGRPGDKGVILLHKFLTALPHRGEGLSRIIYGYTEVVLAAFLSNIALAELIMPDVELFPLPEKVTKKSKTKLRVVHPMKGLAKSA